MKILICDSNEEELNELFLLLTHYCNRRCLTVELEKHTSGKELLLDFEPNTPQIIFLEIYIQDLNGIHVAQEIRKRDPHCPIIFVTHSEYHTLEAFSVKALDYLIKPLTYNKLEKTLDEDEALFSPNLRSIEVMAERLNVHILLKDILYIEIYDTLCHIHTTTHLFKTYTSLGTLEKQLGGFPFLRCHRSYIVNMCYVTSYTDSEFILTNGDHVALRKVDALSLKQTWLDYTWDLTQSLQS